MEEDERTVARRREGDYRFGRILAVSAGVFAFSLTLLVVELVVPAASSNSALAEQLLAQWPELFSYLLSFAVVPVTCNGHHDTFRSTRPVDAWLSVLTF